MNVEGEVAPVQVEGGEACVLHRWGAGMFDGMAVDGAKPGGGRDVIHGLFLWFHES